MDSGKSAAENLLPVLGQADSTARLELLIYYPHYEWSRVLFEGAANRYHIGEHHNGLCFYHCDKDHEHQSPQECEVKPSRSWNLGPNNDRICQRSSIKSGSNAIPFQSEANSRRWFGEVGAVRMGGLECPLRDYHHRRRPSRSRSANRYPFPGDPNPDRQSILDVYTH